MREGFQGGRWGPRQVQGTVFMSRQDDRNGEERVSAFADAGMGALRITLLFGSAAVALALLLVPIVDRDSRTLTAQASVAGVDLMETGSIGSGRRYTIQHSVLQTSPNAICIINQDGSRSGDC
jgi:hypothetical protein